MCVLCMYVCVRIYVYTCKYIVVALSIYKAKRNGKREALTVLHRHNDVFGFCQRLAEGTEVMCDDCYASSFINMQRKGATRNKEHGKR